MNNDVYEVERDEYAGFVSGLKKEVCEVEEGLEKGMKYIKIRSKLRDVHLCTRFIFDDGTERYYIFNMPTAEESVPVKPVLKITLDTREAVQEFFDALSKVQKGEVVNDRTISRNIRGTKKVRGHKLDNRKYSRRGARKSHGTR